MNIQTDLMVKCERVFLHTRRRSRRRDNLDTPIILYYKRIQDDDKSTSSPSDL